MFFHFDFANYFAMVRLAWNEKNPRARRTYLAKLLLWVPPVSLFHAVCFFLDNLFFPGLHERRSARRCSWSATRAAAPRSCIA